MMAQLAVGEVGEIVVRDDLIMAGYWKMPDKSAETLIDGWLHTGDRRFVDTRGYLYLKDRLHEVVITGGFNVYPTDVESVLGKKTFTEVMFSQIMARNASVALR